MVSVEFFFIWIKTARGINTTWSGWKTDEFPKEIYFQHAAVALEFKSNILNLWTWLISTPISPPLTQNAALIPNNNWNPRRENSKFTENYFQFSTMWKFELIFILQSYFFIVFSKPLHLFNITMCFVIRRGDIRRRNIVNPYTCEFIYAQYQDTCLVLVNRSFIVISMIVWCFIMMGFYDFG